MININVLTFGANSSNGVAFIFPLVFWRKQLLESGINVHMHNRVVQNITDCDVLFIDSKFYKNSFNKNKEKVLKTLSFFSNKTKSNSPLKSATITINCH